MQLSIVRGHAGRLEDPVLRAMFEARKQVFADLLKWDVPVLGGRYEVDQFDDVNATYLVLSEAGGGHLASARLLETERPHILDSLFPDLCEDPPPRGPAIREITRFCLDRRLTARTRRGVRDTLVHALARHALDHGITSYTGVAEMGWLQQILAFGWDCAPLGLPRYHGTRLLGALRIAITPDTPHLLALAGLADLAPPPALRRLAA
ncbi:MAG TPA: acyl-homoserine-lactone synthase [Sphingomonas sp.]|nr:acyl-homoserine-lactone synthase [Sphingomonas sp.]